ncbi:MAG TPA: hypothetical protein VF103_19015 [Polyangiaceae bacterium]
MPDPVSYQNVSSSSHVVECEPVPVGPETATESASDFDCFEAEPGVRSLVERHTETSPRRAEPAQADIPYAEIGRHCLSKAVGVAAALESFSELGVFKSTLELVECVYSQINEAQDSANIERAAELCEDEGGIPTGVIRGELQCIDPEVFK